MAITQHKSSRFGITCIAQFFIETDNIAELRTSQNGGVVLSVSTMTVQCKWVKNVVQCYRGQIGFKLNKMQSKQFSGWPYDAVP